MNSGIMDFPRDKQIVQVHTTSGRGFTPEEIAKRCADRLMYVADSAPLEIREQAMAFKDHIERVVALYMHEAIASDRTTVYNALKAAGHADLAELIRRI
jgi:hypothetical protein